MEKRIKLEQRARKANQITELNLDNCRSTSIVGLTDEYTALESLSLINVGLTTLKGFPKLPNLKKLELSDNRISNGLNYLTTSPKLQYLNLSGNKIKDLETLKPLEEFQKLAVLDLFNNDATQVENYREKIFKMLPSLTFLDGFDCNDEVQSEGEDDEEGNDSDEAMSPPKKSHAAKKPDNNVVLQAIKSCIIDENAIRKSAREHGINDRTLSRYVKKTKDNFEDISKLKDEDLLEFIHCVGTRTPSNMVFSPAQEKDLVRYILKYVSHYYGLSINELKELAYQFARKLSIRYPPEWDNDCKAHRKWYRLFMQRHSELTLRTQEQTSMNRVKAFCKPNVDNFFENLSRLIDVHNFDGCSIYNMNESGFSTVPTKIGKVIALKGQLEAAERGTMVTLALTVCANGNTVPPFFLFPGKNMERTCLDNVSPGIAGFANDSGWMGQPEFVRYIRHFIKFVKPSKDRPVLLLMDNHVSHMSVEALDFADANGVHILSFPPHCSHRLQPLDVSVLGPMKTYYESQCSAWQNNNANKVLEIQHIAGLVCNALDFALTPKIIKAGFAATGIAPFNPDIFTDADFVQTIAQNEEQVAFDAGITKDDQRRIVLNNTMDIGHGKEVLTSEISTPQSLSLMSLVTSSSSVLDEIDPLQVPEKTAAKGAKKRATPGNTKRATPSRASKRFKPTSPPSDDETDFCIICLKLLPQKLTTANSINCNVCKRPVHFKCSNVQASYFTCKSCESDVDDDDGE